MLHEPFTTHKYTSLECRLDCKPGHRNPQNLIVVAVVTVVDILKRLNIGTHGTERVAEKQARVVMLVEECALDESIEAAIPGG